MLRLILAGALALAAVAACAATPFATLTIKVEKVSPRGGDVRVALYDRDNYPLNNADPVTDAVVPAHPGETIITLKPVKPGIYAVKLFQDLKSWNSFTA